MEERCRPDQRDFRTAAAAAQLAGGSWRRAGCAAASHSPIFPTGPCYTSQHRPERFHQLELGKIAVSSQLGVLNRLLLSLEPYLAHAAPAGNTTHTQWLVSTGWQQQCLWCPASPVTSNKLTAG
jgi:hypothetical protein